MAYIFTEGGFARVIRAGDSRRFGINLKQDRETLITQAVAASTVAVVGKSKVHRTRIKRRLCVSIKDYSHNLILRSLSKYLTRKFKIFPRSRDSIVREIVDTLSDCTPMYVIRRDISSFYESLSTRNVRKLLEYDAHIPPSVRRHIKSYFEHLCLDPIGIPRGVGVSAIISELIMRPIDEKIRQISGVYKYFRYSDDILIFGFGNPERIYECLHDTMRDASLKFNHEKSFDIPLLNSEKEKRKTVYFEYLGYKFLTHDGYGDTKSRPVLVTHSDRKISKIKSRIILSFKNFKQNGNFDLLFDRMMFLASNYRVYRNGASTVKTSVFVRSGIYYNYRLCGEYKGKKENRYGCNHLKSLDGFYQSLLTGSGSEFRASFASPAVAHRLKKLQAISFYKGFALKMTVKMTPDRVQEIKGVWRNA